MRKLILLLFVIFFVSCSADKNYETPSIMRVYESDNVAQNVETPWFYSFPSESVIASETPEIVKDCSKFWNILTDRNIAVKKRAEFLLKLSSSKMSIGQFQLPELFKDREQLLIDFISFLDLKRLIKRVGDERWNFKLITLEDFKILEPRLKQSWIKLSAVADLTMQLQAGAKIIMLAEKQPWTENLLIVIVKPKMQVNENTESVSEILSSYEVLNISAFLSNR